MVAGEVSAGDFLVVVRMSSGMVSCFEVKVEAGQMQVGGSGSTSKGVTYDEDGDVVMSR